VIQSGHRSRAKRPGRPSALGGTAHSLRQTPVQHLGANRRRHRVNRHATDGSACDVPLLALSDEQENVALRILERSVEEGLPHAFQRGIGNHEQAAALPHLGLARRDERRRDRNVAGRPRDARKLADNDPFPTARRSPQCRNVWTGIRRLEHFRKDGHDRPFDNLQTSIANRHRQLIVYHRLRVASAHLGKPHLTTIIGRAD